jgi:citrate lyase subunit beta/citryl-CoA lyase
MFFRSLIFVPGNSKRFIDKAETLDADVVCFDLEDSVPLNEKDTARQMIAEVLAKQNVNKKIKNVYVRINSFESGLSSLDLNTIIQKGLDGIVIPKTDDAIEVIEIKNLISSLEYDREIEKDSIKIMASIESAKGVVNAFSIAKSDPRVKALVFGVFDYLYDMRLDYVDNQSIQYSYAHTKIPVDARAAGILAIDAIWQQVDDIEGLKKDAMIGKQLGYAGKSVVHPSQIEPVHRVFIPSKGEIEWAKKVIEALDHALAGGEKEEEGRSKGAIKLEGKMIDAVHYKQAKAILEITETAKGSTIA